MPKSSANVPHSQPSIDRLKLTTEQVRAGAEGSFPGVPVGTPCMCFEAEASSSTFCHTVCFVAD